MSSFQHHSCTGILADRDEAITIEAVGEGLNIYDNPVGVLTNNPPFDKQLFRLNDYSYLSPDQPVNRFSEQLQLQTYSRGMGAMGLPVICPLPPVLSGWLLRK